MSEEMKPCPACGSNTVELHDLFGQCYAACDNITCCVNGPNASCNDDAIAAWNALPRALVWTTDPPKHAGHYWCRYKSEDKEAWSVAYVPAVTDWCGIDDENDRVEWAGPIPEPQETIS